MYVILGCGSVGYATAKILRERGRDVLIVDKGEKRVEDLRDAGLPAVVGAMEALSPFQEILEGATAVLLLSQNMAGNLAALKYLKELAPKAYVVARAVDPVSADAFRRAGAASVLHPGDVIAKSVVRELQEFEVHRAADELTRVVSGAGSFAIVLQDNPDPDALASGLAFQRICEHLGVKGVMYYGGRIGHQENRAFVNLLELELHHLGKKDDVADIVRRHGRIALVEAVIPGKNNSLPLDVTPHVVFDHHQVAEADIKAEFADVRSGVGATSTILTRYLQQMNVKVDAGLAVALLYGIRTDTRSFTRGATAEDMAAATFLSPYADMELLDKIETPPLSGETVEVLGRAIRNRAVYGSYLLSNVELINDRDVLPQAADFLLRLEGVSTVLVFGIVEDVIHLSARSNDVRVNLGEVLEKAFGKQQAGGHARMAGGQIKLGIFGDVEDPEALLRLAGEAVRKQFFSALGVDERSVEKRATEKKA